MFAKTIVLSDAFLDMPLGARCLYMTMGMLADDDGFVNAPKSIMRQSGATEDDLKILIAKKFVIPFESGVIVIKHWRINNYLQKDRIQPTKYQYEMAFLNVDENGSYSKSDCIQKDVYTEDVYIDKYSIDKNSIDKNNNIYGDFNPKDADGFYPPEEDVDGFFNEIWKLYPRKEGKGKVSKTKKKVLYQIGKDQMVKCIERYKMFIKEKGYEDKFIMHGSTFFNSGYVDYLDENYTSSDANDNQISMFSDSEEWQ